ncbi:MAG: hypothetical protein ABJN26_03290 [Stappiaceae bacterium]
MKKPRIFLKNVEVSLEKDAYAAGSSVFSRPDEYLTKDLLNQLSTVFAIPSVPPETQILDSDFGIDLKLIDYPARSTVGTTSEEWETPVLKRAMVRLNAELSLLHSGETVRVFSTQEGPTFPEHLIGIVCLLAGGGGPSSKISREELGVMLNKASLDLMKQMVSFVYR